MKASAINARYTSMPRIHRSSRGALYEPYKNALNICRYTTMKNADAPVECR